MPITSVPFGEWLPDLPALNNPGATEAKNVIPFANSYLPLKAISPITDAINARCRGAITVRDKSGNVYSYTGDETKLYSLAANVHSDVTNTGGAYALSSEENWKFTKFGETIIAVCIDENPQVITLGDANFTDLAGSPPKARHITNINNFVVLANIDDGTLRPNRVRWSAINNAESWTPDADTQADFQDLISDNNVGGGWIMGMTGGEYGNIFQEYSIWRMTYAGSPLIFQFDEVLPGIGTPCKNSIVQEGRVTHFFGQDGFYQMMDGSQVTPIGKNKVDNYFINDFDASYPERVIGAADPLTSIVSWIYPGAGNTNGRPNKMISYDWINQKWSHADLDLEWIYPALSQGFTAETLDTVNTSLDEITPSLDARVWKGGALQIALYDTDNKKGTFGGIALDGVIETSEVQAFKGKRGFVSGVRALVDGDNTIQIGTRDLLSESVTWSDEITPETDTGIASARSDARYHRIRVNTSGDFTHAQGVDIIAQPSGFR